MNGNDKTMDTAPGGESTQYESIKTVTEPSATESGQLGSESSSSKGAPVSDRGQKTAENIRYSQNISESGMGGMTNSTGSAGQQGGYGGVARDSEQEQAGTRKSQGYGAGSGVGA